MAYNRKSLSHNFSRFFSFIAVISLLPFLGFHVLVQATDSTPLNPSGYADFSYGTTVAPNITGEKPESKLWWNDGFWWGSLFSPQAGEFHIFRLNWGTQTWEDTGVALDDRPDTKADTLWDASANKLYIVSHIHTLLGSTVKEPVNYGRLYRFTYDAVNQTYLLDPGFPVTVNKDKTETLVLSKALNGWLWVTYVSRVPPSNDYYVYVNSSSDGGNTWGLPFILPFSQAKVSFDDISSIFAFKDGGVNKVGTVWSNQLDGNLYMAVHPDSNTDPAAGWQISTIPIPHLPIDDHISIKTVTTSSPGQVFIGVKTGLTNNPDDPLIGLIARDTDGTFSFHKYSTISDNDTRPIVLIDEGNPATTADDKLYEFVSGKEFGSSICYKSLPITSPLSSMGDFTPANCGVPFIQDAAIDNIDNATSTKQNVNNITGMVVLASDDLNGQMYVHNATGNPPPVVTSRMPGINATNVPIDTAIQVTFSKPMDPATINNTTFIVEDGSGPLSGAIAYDVASRTATFAPAAPLHASSTYTVKLTPGIEDVTGLALNQGFDSADPREQWSFTTESVMVQFSSDNFSANEADGTATITATLNTTSNLTVTVDYASSNGTATAGIDYTAASGTLTFNPGETTKSFDVTVLEDANQEGNETVLLALSNANNATLGSPKDAVLTIIDNDGPPQVQFKTLTYNLKENDGTAQIQVILSQQVGTAVTVDYATSNGTAQAGADYTAVSGTLTFNPNVTQATFTVPIKEDALDEENETVNLVLSNPSSPVELSPTGSQATLVIEDINPPPSVRFAHSSYSVNEDGGSAAINISLSSASGKPVTVNYSTSNGSATAGADYNATSGMLTINPGQTTASFTVPILTDGIDEENETVHLNLDTPGNAVLGTPANALLTIADMNPSPAIQFSSAKYVVDETAGKATITVTLSAVSGRTVSVDYLTTEGTAKAGKDYTSKSGTLIFLPGTTSLSFDVPIAKDNLNEPDETILLTLSGTNDVNLGNPSTAILVIKGNWFGAYMPIIQR